MYFLEQVQYFYITFVGSWTFLRTYKFQYLKPEPLVRDTEKSGSKERERHKAAQSLGTQLIYSHMFIQCY